MKLAVRALSNLGGQNARVDTRKQGISISLESETLISLVVGSADDGIEVSLGNSPLLPNPGDLLGATGYVAGCDAAGSELVCAVSQRGALDGAEKFTSLGNLLSEIVAGMRRNEAGEKCQAGDGLGNDTHCDLL